MTSDLELSCLCERTKEVAQARDHRMSEDQSSVFFVSAEMQFPAKQPFFGKLKAPYGNPVGSVAYEQMSRDFTEKVGFYAATRHYGRNRCLLFREPMNQSLPA